MSGVITPRAFSFFFFVWTRMPFITLEGIDGSGKTTNAGRLCDYITSRGHNVVRLREPGTTALGQQIREILFSESSRGFSDAVEMMLFLTARKDLVDSLILPEMTKGSFIVSDRFHDSTIAYQGYGRGLLEEVTGIGKILFGDFKPDHTLFFNISDEEANKRLSARGEFNYLDLESKDFILRTRRGYRALFEQYRHQHYVEIDANPEPDAVWKQIQDWVDRTYFSSE